MILVDTSVWINLFGFQKKHRFSESDLLSCATCPPVVQEILQGIKSDKVFYSFKEKFLSLHCVSSPVTMELFLEAVEIYRFTRKKGITIRSSVDCLIAAIAIENNLTIWHHDRDFDLISKFTKLKVTHVFEPN